RTISVVLTFLLTVVWLSPLFSQFNHFSKRAGDALSDFYEMDDTIRWETKNGGEKEIPAGQIFDDHPGFKWVRRAITHNRPGVRSDENRHGKIVKICLTKGDSELEYNGVFGDIIPGNFAFVEFDDGQFVPFIEDERENRSISTWTNREIERFTGSIVVAIIFLWTLVSLLLIWIPR
ncbi:hypothetical protein PM022_19455, partial [Halorubrum ezzemoulense]|uniref:hypothetical protein n=1 Tax=Halorubrum ezzemoulense TaxID=337243 RepID=UPI00232F2DEC